MHGGDEALFAGYDPPADTPGLSPGRRLTLRQAAQVAAGVHPLTRAPLHPLASRHRDDSAPGSDPYTCGSCYFRGRVNTGHASSYPKCLLPAPQAGADAPAYVIYSRVTNGPASDVRAWWPACGDYSPGDVLSPDAARSLPD